MSIGSFFDRAIAIGFGAYIIYFSHKKKEALGKKSKMDEIRWYFSDRHSDHSCFNALSFGLRSGLR